MISFYFLWNFKGYAPFTVIIKYWLYSLWCTLYIHVAYLIPSSSYLAHLTPVMTLSSSSWVISSLLHVCLILCVIFTSLIFVHDIRKEQSCILKIPHISDILQYMSFSAWLISLSIMPSESTHVAANGKIMLFFLIAE